MKFLETTLTLLLQQHKTNRLNNVQRTKGLNIRNKKSKKYCNFEGFKWKDSQ